MELPYDPAILFIGIYSKELKVGTQIFEHHVHCNIIHNSQKVEATKMSLDEGLYKENIVCIFNEHY